MSHVFPAPPPTTNALSPAARSRLLRSSRKLGAVLGTTPVVLDAPTQPLLPIGPKAAPATHFHRRACADPAARRARRQGSIFELPRWQDGAGFGSDESIFSCDDSDVSSARTSMEDSDASVYNPLTRMATGSASLVYLPLHAASDCTSSESEHDKKPFTLRFAAGRRTVKHRPPPLMLQLQQPAFNPANIPSHSCFSPDTADLYDAYPVDPLSPPATAMLFPPTPAPATPAATRDLEARVRKLAKLSRHLGENVPLELVFGRPTLFSADKPASPADSSAERKTRNRRSLSLSAATPKRAGTMPSVRDVGALRFAVVHTELPTEILGLSAIPAASQVLGNEGWVGEWNRDDMRQVRSGLRALRAR